jgi:LPXTG-motif cell wall-anchored protein
MQSVGGTLTATFTGDCDIPGSYIFSQVSTINGPTNGSLTLNFTGEADPNAYTGGGFTARANFNLSNLGFTRPSNAVGFDSFIYGNNQSDNNILITVSDSTFSNAQVSAAIYVEGALTVSNSTFANLTSGDEGAAIYQPPPSGTPGDVSVINSSFDSNRSSGNGGAISTWGALNISDSTFDSNRSTGADGGALASRSGNTVVTNSSFYGNTADNVAGAIASASVAINNSTFVENRAFSNGAVFSEGGVISNSTFWGNSARNPKSAASADIAFDGGGYLFANILAGKAPELSDPVFDLGANLFTDSSFVPTTVGSGASKLVTLDELKLSALALNQTLPTNAGTTETLAIATDSVAYDFYSADSAGINPTAGGQLSSLLAQTDQRGAGRPFGAGYDVGAFEIGETPEPTPSETPEPTPSETSEPTPSETPEPTPSETSEPTPSESPEVTYKETLADTGSPSNTGFLGLAGLGVVAILGGSAGILRRRKNA